MDRTSILILGANGQIGSELVTTLRNIYGNESVVASDLEAASPILSEGIFHQLNVLETEKLARLIKKVRPTVIYHLAALLSASCEIKPQLAWEVNVNSFLRFLEVCREEKVGKIFWPSSIGAFGPDTPKQKTPQITLMNPTTVYGISKLTGERWCEYYHQKYGMDIRSLRYPGLISYKTLPGGGTTDYAVDIYHQAVKESHYHCYLRDNTMLPMMYMDDAIRATLQLMDADPSSIRVRSSYNLAAISFTPAEIADKIRNFIPDFTIDYKPDFRQKIADSWPLSIDDSAARKDWGWQHEFDLDRITEEMLKHIDTSVLS